MAREFDQAICPPSLLESSQGKDLHLLCALPAQPKTQVALNKLVGPFFEKLVEDVFCVHFVLRYFARRIL